MSNDFKIVHNRLERYFELRDQFDNCIRRMHYEDTFSLAASLRIQSYAQGYMNGFEAARNALRVPVITDSVMEIGI